MATKIVTKNSSTASAVPTASDLVQGELAVNVADKRLFTEDNGGSIVELGTNPSALTVTGEITANGGIALGDNDKATFGAGDDLEIYHNGSNSIITETGTGNLYLGGDNLLLTNGSLSAAYLEAITGGAVNIYHNGSTKLATTSTGIDVTGNMISDGVGIGTSSPATGLHLEHSNAGATSGTIRIQDRDSQQDANQQTGGIEFYTQDATNPTEGVSTAIKSFSASSSGGAYLTLSTTDVNTSTLDERMRIDSSGNIRLTGTAPNSEDNISTINFFNSS